MLYSFLEDMSADFLRGNERGDLTTQKAFGGTVSCIGDPDVSMSHCLFEGVGVFFCPSLADSHLLGRPFALYPSS